MSRSWSVLVLAMLLLGGLAALPGAYAAHEWGHRFMVTGRIIDAEGNPAQLVDVTLAIESVERPDPQMTVTTDCTGFYHSLTQKPRPTDYRLDNAGGGGYRMHIHNIAGGREYDQAAQYIVATPFAEYRGDDALTPTGPLAREQLHEFAIHTARADRERQQALASIRLAETLEARPECEDAPDWRSDHIVVGKAQHATQRGREEAVLANTEVNVTIETTQGPRSQTVFTDVTAMYLARFENVTLADGAQVTVRFEGEEYTGAANSEFGVTSVPILQRDPLIGTGTWIFLGIIAAVVVVGAAVWGAQRMKERRSVEKARQTSTRKRARR